MSLQVMPPVHPAAALFPAMSDEEFAALRCSIEEHGQQEPIIMFNGSILDGRNRYRACTEIGALPKTREYENECGSPTAFVMAMNLNRRHLTASQRAAVATDALPLFEQEARERQRKAGQKSAPGRPAEKASQTFDTVSTRATEQAAQAAGTNRQYVSDAKKLKADAPDLFEQVREGEKTLPKAKKEAEQRQMQAEGAQVMEILERRDTSGEIAASRLRLAYSEGVKHVYDELLPLDPDAVATVLRPDDMVTVRAFMRSTRDWLSRLEIAISGGLRVVGGSR